MRLIPLLLSTTYLHQWDCCYPPPTCIHLNGCMGWADTMVLTKSSGRLFDVRTHFLSKFDESQEDPSQLVLPTYLSLHYYLPSMTHSTDIFYLLALVWLGSCISTVAWAEVTLRCRLDFRADRLRSGPSSCSRSNEATEDPSNEFFLCLSINDWVSSGFRSWNNSRRSFHRAAAS